MAKTKKSKSLQSNKLLSEFALQCMRAMERAKLKARKVAKIYGTPIVYMRNGKTVEEYPYISLKCLGGCSWPLSHKFA